MNEATKPWNTTPKPPSSAAQNTPFANDATSSLSASNPPDYWYETIAHTGTSPFIPGGAQWKIFRNVVSDYGADPRGAGDSQSAFQRAIEDGTPTEFKRNTDSLGTTGQPAVIYIPSGTYMLNSPLQLYVGTVLLGNPINPPTLKAGRNFQGNTLIFSKDPHHDSTINFYISIKNLQLDSMNLSPSTRFTILDWSVSQATQLTNVVFNMSNFSTDHTGITMSEEGSGTFMGDLTFNEGVVRLNLVNQQYKVKSVMFNCCITSILINRCFECVFVNLAFINITVRIDMLQDDEHSVTLIDSIIINTGTTVKTVVQTTDNHSLVIENFVFDSDLTFVVTISESLILTDNVPDI